jgi:putative nucleotidyltransferase with HDIG domain
MAAPAAVLPLALLAIQGGLAGPAGAAGTPFLALVLVALGAAAANYPLRITPNYKVDAAPAIDLAMVLLFPAAAAVALVGASRIAGDGILCFRRNPTSGVRRRAPIDLVFNTSQLMVAATAAVIIHAGIIGTVPGLAGTLVAAVLAAAALYVVNTTLVMIAVGLHQRRSPLRVWSDVASSDVKPAAALAVTGYLLALISAGEPWLAVVMMVPVAAVQLAIKRSQQLLEQTIAAVESMADVVDRRDPYTFQHSQSVADHSVNTARRLKLADRDVELIRLAARVHDLGKIAVPDSVLHKQGRLTEQEFELMKRHPEDGAQILAKFGEYRKGRELVLAHHERMDGRGYPRGLTGDQIPLGARIIAVADAWDAMTSDRPYRTALDQEVALAELMRGRDSQWDGGVVDAFASTLPGAPAFEPERHAGIAAPLLRSLGAVAGILTS